MDLGITIEQLQIFLLIFFRMGGILIFAPIFGHRTVPPQTKIGLALVLTIALLPVLPMSIPAEPLSVGAMFLSVAREMMIGVILGFVAQLVFAGIQYAGELISVQMGFSLATVMDPQFENQSPTISELQNILALLVFLGVDGHHWLLNGLARTFDLIPVGKLRYTESLATGILDAGGKLFLIAFQIGAPVMVALFLTTLALGLVSRAVPQLNVFSVSFPIKIAVGLVALALSLRFSAGVFVYLFQQMQQDLQVLIRAMS